MQAVQPSAQVTYLHTPTCGQGRVSEQRGTLEKFVMATDNLTLTTEENTVLDHFRRYSLLAERQTFAVMETR